VGRRRLVRALTTARIEHGRPVPRAAARGTAAAQPAAAAAEVTGVRGVVSTASRNTSGRAK